MAKKGLDAQKSVLLFTVDPSECPFREFRDNELGSEFWGLGPAAFRATMVALLNKTVSKITGEHLWVDEQTQPLPRSVRQYLHGWVRAEELALSRWDIEEVVVFEENNGGKMAVMDIQLSHAQVLMRSSFCRRVLSACFMLERVDSLTVEHQWENFTCSFAPEGWRARYHIYSPGVKPGGGTQHRPGLSKNGCYLVRLFYLGAWRCVWVNDQVPVDTSGAPLLPFSPLLSNAPNPKPKQAPTTVTASVVYLWPLLLCKAILKLAAPDLNADEDSDSLEDELMPEFNILHTLTGGLVMNYYPTDAEEIWKMITSEVPVFSWEDDDDTLPSTVKTKSSKKPINKDAALVRRGSITTVLIADSKSLPPYYLPGITPALQMHLLITMARDLPIKKPLPEPDVALWKYYRWVDWARRHGLYEAYDCPRTRFLKVNGLMKLSYAPHLLDVQSTETITAGFREEHDKTAARPKDAAKQPSAGAPTTQQLKEELREWVQFNPLQELVSKISVVFYPSMFEFTSATSSPPVRTLKTTPNKAIDITAPKSSPLYLQLDGPEENSLKISLHMLHPRILLNAGIPVVDYIEPAYLVLESFEWFIDSELPTPKAFVRTRGYDSVEVNFKPGRHFCRIWVHSRMNWHMMLLSESTLFLGTRDVIQSAAIKECPWAARFLSALGSAFTNWIRINRSNPNILLTDREFFKSYYPDLSWDNSVVGYDRSLLHWMFRQALQSLLMKKLNAADFENVCTVMRKYFCDPDFGLPKKPRASKPLRHIFAADPCDCLVPETEEMEVAEEELCEQQNVEEKPLVDEVIMKKLLTAPSPPIVSQICEYATDDVPCGVLKEAREKVIRRHEAATTIQAFWRGTWARKCLNSHVTFTPDTLKCVLENAFGGLEALSALMNEFFRMYPGAKYAYSVASALSGVYGLHQHHGTTHITPKCKWVPYFQGVFHCHAHVKAHFDVQSTLQYSTVAIYDNDTGFQLPQAFNANVTFDITPNILGYTVMGHGSLSQESGVNLEAHWQLTVLTSIDGVFHVCDNEEPCQSHPLPAVSKLHLDEIFLPNRRNILGGIQIAVTKHEAVSFRAAATSPDLEMVATLRTVGVDGVFEELGTCSGKGEIYWPYIRLESAPLLEMAAENRKESAVSSARSLKTPKTAKSGKAKSMTKLKSIPVESKQYFIEVVAPEGWPLTLMQWKRVDEIRNSIPEVKIEATPKKPTKEKVQPDAHVSGKPGSAKEKEKEKEKQPVPIVAVHQPQPDDAYIQLECSVTIGGGALAKRDDERDLEFLLARRSWDSKEPGRNARGAQIRHEFRTEFMEALPPPPSDTEMTEEILGEEQEGENDKKEVTQQGPSPVTESGIYEMDIEEEEEAKYLTMPDQLRDKFLPLTFLPLCMKDKTDDEGVLVTPDMAEAAKKDRHARIEAALERMRELQAYNELYVLGRQKERCQLLENLSVDSEWPQRLQDAMEERDNAIAKETLQRTLSANKKKAEVKKK